MSAIPCRFFCSLLVAAFLLSGAVATSVGDEQSSSGLAPDEVQELSDYPSGTDLETPKTSGKAGDHGGKGCDGAGMGAGYPGYRGQGETDAPHHRQYGSPPRSPDNSNSAIARTLLQMAARGKLVEVQALLKQGVDANTVSSDKNARSALILAAAGGHIETVRVLLVAGANVDGTDGAGLTALGWAALRGRSQVAGLLLEHGADVNTADSSGVTPLMYAVGTHNVELSRLLLERGADRDALSEENRMTPLLVAVENGDSVSASLLLDYGADVNGVNRQGYSPLMAAVESGQPGMVALLLSHGADAVARNQDGLSAFSLAQQGGNTKIMEILASSTGGR